MLFIAFHHHFYVKIFLWFPFNLIYVDTSGEICFLCEEKFIWNSWISSYIILFNRLFSKWAWQVNITLALTEWWLDINSSYDINSDILCTIIDEWFNTVYFVCHRFYSKRKAEIEQTEYNLQGLLDKITTVSENLFNVSLLFFWI